MSAISSRCPTTIRSASAQRRTGPVSGRPAGHHDRLSVMADHADMNSTSARVYGGRPPSALA